MMTDYSSTSQFTDSATKQLPSLVAKGEPSPYTLTEGNGSIIFITQHSGKHVPESLYDDDGLPLGLPHEYFETQHEACDLGTQELMDKLRKSEQQRPTLEVNYSRLCLDTNRDKDSSITLVSSEYPDKLIPGNANLTKEQEQQRYDTFYHPFRNALKNQIEEVKRQNNGCAIVIDIHSFTPTWREETRDLDIGTIVYHNNTLEDATATSLQKLCAANGLRFEANAPYDHKKMNEDRSDTANFIEACGAIYTGIEINQGILTDPTRAPLIAKIMELVVQDIEAQAPTFYQRDKAVQDVALTPPPETGPS